MHRIILLSFILLGIWFSMVIPAFETPDEHYHYAFARHLAQGNPLPVQAEVATGPWEQEGSQAPLYYWLVGRLTAGIDQRDFEAISALNPRANLGDPLFPGNKNRMLYSAVDWPLAGANLALRVGRWFSLLLGVVTLLSLYATARLVFPTRPQLALLALAVAAWLPQFVFLSASFTNDTLIIALASVTVFWLARMVSRDVAGSIGGDKATRWQGDKVTQKANSLTLSPPHPFTPSSFNRPAGLPWWEWMILGMLLGLAALSKLQGLGLWLLAALVGGLMAWQRREWRVLLHAALPVALPALAISGWWYWRNFTLYGDWTGLGHLASITGMRSSPLTWSGWWREFRGLRYSSWGLFGWFNLLLPLWVYTVLDGVTLLAMGGGLWAAITRLRQGRTSASSLRTPVTRVYLLLWLWAMISAAALLYWISRATGSQGRLIFPALVPLVILLIAGLDVWRRRIPTRWLASPWIVRGVPALLPALLLGCTLYTGAWIVPRAYAAPRPIAAIPDTASPAQFRFDHHQALQLLAIEVAPGHYTPGDSVDVTVYMAVDPERLPAVPAPERAPFHPRPAAFLPIQDYQLFIQFLDEDGVEVGNLTTHPGWGRNPTSLWQPGAIYADTYPVRVLSLPDNRSPLLARIYVGFVNPATEESGRFPIVAYGAEGNEVTPTIAGHVALYPPAPPDAGALELARIGTRFGDAVELHAARVERTTAGGEDQLHLQLLWEAAAPPAQELTAFVHLLDEEDQWLGGHDAAPSPRFPTQYWQAGDRILSEWTVALPAPETDPNGEALHIWAGLYPTAEMGAVRTLVTQDGGQMVRHNMVWLGEVP